MSIQDVDITDLAHRGPCRNWANVLPVKSRASLVNIKIFIDFMHTTLARAETRNNSTEVVKHTNFKLQ